MHYHCWSIISPEAIWLISGVNETLLNVHNEIIRARVDSIRYCWYHHSLLFWKFIFIPVEKFVGYNGGLIYVCNRNRFFNHFSIGSPYEMEPAFQIRHSTLGEFRHQFHKWDKWNRKSKPYHIFMAKWWTSWAIRKKNIFT